MEKITSRKNQYIARLRALNTAGDALEMLLDGTKLLDEALASGAEITSILWVDKPSQSVSCSEQFIAPLDIVQYASPLKNSPGPVFTVRRKNVETPESPQRVIVLENVQDPGNVGTVIRGAAALGMDAVILVGACANPWSASSARASMGAIFRQCILRTDVQELRALLDGWSLPLYGAALHEDAADIRSLDMSRCAVAIGNEGKGLSEELLAVCDRAMIIPMTPGSESLNAAMAATITMWEMYR